MSQKKPILRVLPCLDSDSIAASRQKDLMIPRKVAAELGQSAVQAARNGFYKTGTGKKVDWGDVVNAAISDKVSIAPNQKIPEKTQGTNGETLVRITNETTLGASRRLIDQGLRPLALNFASGISPGGGFLRGARAQEETLCRSSALYLTLEGDPMYDRHLRQRKSDSSKWAILSPDVPVFRTDDGEDLDEPWLLSFITCAAPYGWEAKRAKTRAMLKERIDRVLSIAQAYEYSALVLGAWGCGAFGNDTLQTAQDFKDALENDFSGVFSDVVFAITDWSPDRRFLGPFRDVFQVSALPCKKENSVQGSCDMD